MVAVMPGWRSSPAPLATVKIAEISEREKAKRRATNKAARRARRRNRS